MSSKAKKGKEPITSGEKTSLYTKENRAENLQLSIAKKEIIYQNTEKEKRASELVLANEELAFQSDEKEKRAAELIIANKELAFQNKEKQKRADELYVLNEQLRAKEQQLQNHINAIAVSNASIEFDLEGYILTANQNFLKIMGYAKKDLIGKHHSLFVDKEYAKSAAYKQFWTTLKKGVYQKDEFQRVTKKGKSVWLLGSYNPILDISGNPYKILKLATDVTLAKRQFLQLATEAVEKEKRASELVIAVKELAFQNKEKEKRAAELIIANKELEFQNEQKEKRASELVIAVKELAFQNEEKEKRAAELIIANKELEFQNNQKEDRASELVIAVKELAFQNEEKEKRAAELIIANKELEFQNKQKEKRAIELVTAHKELAHQSREKEKRAAELIIANKKLALENIQKEKRKAEKEKSAAALIVTNRELAYQEKRGKELTLANNELKKAQEELGAFSYSVSHDLRAPIRAINGYTQILVEDHADSIDEDGKKVLQAVIHNSRKMGLLIDDLLAFSKLGRKQVSASAINMDALVNGVINDIVFDADAKTPLFDLQALAPSNGDPSLIKQVWINLISNAIKYSQYKPEIRIKITSAVQKDKIVYCVQDYGAGFDMEYYDKLFGVFQRLHSQEEFDGTGIGLAIVQKIVSRHHGAVWAESKLDTGSSFYFSLPNIQH
ncbi:PAS domain-containing sensor histidine kinase [Flavobacterium cupreum]|uniref:PAS domain-containing sensor histidine kinase n=1 Tax=Flavobacterium cupreum TaxID=2133766 RepID=UPI001375F60E|nr:ATP-binding protein [Flavobacterium cupreum]